MGPKFQCALLINQYGILRPNPVPSVVKLLRTGIAKLTSVRSAQQALIGIMQHPSARARRLQLAVKMDIN